MVVVAVVAGLVLAAVAYVGVRYAVRDRPGAEPVGAAVRTFHGSGPVAASTSGVDGAYSLPQAGVYRLSGQGEESISVPPNSQRDGAVMPATVTHLRAECWRWHIDYNVAHSETYQFCAGPSGLLQQQVSNVQTWDFGVTEISNTATITCPAATVVLPALPAPGQSWQWSCPETNTSIGGRSTSTTSAVIVGMDELSVAGTTVAAVHERQRSTVTGVQTGTVTEDWWFSRTSGLPLRVERSIAIHTSSPLGVITYTESGSWQLSSLTALG